MFRVGVSQSEFRSFNIKEAPLRLSTVIIVRHPEYDSKSGSLTPEGIKQASSLAMQITDKIPSIENALIVTSTAKRAVETADILSHALRVPVEQSDAFLTDAHTDEDIPAAIEFIKAKQDDYDVIIVVTHLEYADALPRACNHAFFGGSTGYFCCLQTGQAYIVQPGKAILLR